MKNITSNEFVCIAKGTNILLKNGKTQEIEKIILGTEIKNFNVNHNTVEIACVEKIAISIHSILITVFFSNDTLIKSTQDHPYWVVGKGWCSLDTTSTLEKYNLNVNKLIIGDKCLYFDGEKLENVIIKNIVTEIGKFEMYNISGGVNRCFFANGILVHDENLMELDLSDHEVEFQIAESI
ncbi:MAG: hypothetical protein KAT68_19180 [Bacteroidales bacterium]|nr:hypothetical protein [Bacteroidales bacterium]